MKRIYERPSMAMSLFDAVDTTNAINVKSIVGVKGLTDDDVRRNGITIINGKLNS